MAGTAKTVDTERPRECRVPVHLPMLVRGTDRDGKWFQERTVLENVSTGGAAFTAMTELARDSIIYVSIPAPTPEEPDAEFSTKAQIVYVKAGKNAQEIRIGVKFIGPRFKRTSVSLWT